MKLVGTTGAATAAIALLVLQQQQEHQFAGAALLSPTLLPRVWSGGSRQPNPSRQRTQAWQQQQQQQQQQHQQRAHVGMVGIPFRRKRGAEQDAEAAAAAAAAATQVAEQVPEVSEAQEASIEESSKEAEKGAVARMPGVVVKYVRDFFRNTKVLGAEWKEGMALKRKVKKEGHVLTYPEYDFLKRGERDRRDVFSFFAVYALVPELITMYFYLGFHSPSVYERPESALERVQKKKLKYMSVAVRHLIRLQDNRLKAGKARKPAPEALHESAERLLLLPDKETAFRSLQQHFYVAPKGPKGEGPSPYTVVPNDATACICQGLGLTKRFMPAMFVRTRLSMHVKDLTEGDDILARTPLEDIPDKVLREACVVRGIDVASGRMEMEKDLQAWLKLTSPADGEAHTLGQAKAAEGLVFSPEVAKTALLGLNMVAAVRDSENMGALGLLGSKSWRG